MNTLTDLITQLENHISYFDKKNTIVSQSTVGWQIDHSLLVINGIVSTIEKSNPDEYKWNFNLIRTLIMFREKIPRGKAKAPKTVVPGEEITIESLKRNIEKAKYMVTKLNSLHNNQFFKHPYFGDLNLKPTVKFLGIHTNHHLKIIKDIVK